MRSRLRLSHLVLVATLIIVAGSSIRTAHATVDITLNSRQYNGASVNLGQMLLDGQGPYNLPYNTRVPAGNHKIRFIPPAGFYFVVWELDGVVRPFEHTELNLYGSAAGLGHPDDPTVTAIYQKIGQSAYVGGVVLSTNTMTVLAPYLAVISLVATVGVIAVKKRRN